MKLDIKAFSITCGLIWGFGLLLGTWWIMLFDGSITEPNLISRVYRGYSITPLGSLIGCAWALVDGAAGGAIFAWLYNLLAAKGAAHD